MSSKCLLPLVALALSGALPAQPPSMPVGQFVGAGVPALNCLAGQHYFRTDALAGANLFDCTSTGWKARTVYGATTLLWDDARAPLSDLSPGATPCNIVIFGAAGAVRARDCAVGEDMDGVIQLPHAYAEGTDIHPHVHWAPINANAGNVRWGLDYYWLNHGDAAAGAPTTILTADQATGSMAWKSNMALFPAVSGAGKAISSMLVFRVFRSAAAAGGGEYGSRAVIMEFDIHFQADSLGSAATAVK